MSQPNQQRVLSKELLARNQNLASRSPREEPQADPVLAPGKDGPRQKASRPELARVKLQSQTDRARLASPCATATSGPKGQPSSWPRGGCLQPAMVIVEQRSQEFARLKRALWKAGATARVWWAQTAEEALEILAELEKHVTRICIVADLPSRNDDGFHLLDLVRARKAPAQCSFVYLVHADQQGAQATALAHGADAFIVKPAELEGLIDVARCLQKLAKDHIR